MADTAPLTPGLPPHELQTAGGRKVFFDGVVHPLDEHAGQIRPLEQIWHCGAVAKGVYCPTTARSYTCNSQRRREFKISPALKRN